MHTNQTASESFVNLIGAPPYSYILKIDSHSKLIGVVIRKKSCPLLDEEGGRAIFPTQRLEAISEFSPWSNLCT